MGKYTELFTAETGKHLTGVGGAPEALPEGNSMAAAPEAMGRKAHSIKGMTLSEEQELTADPVLALEKTCRGEGSRRSGIPPDLLREGVALPGKMIHEADRDGVCRSEPGRVVAAPAGGTGSG